MKFIIYLITVVSFFSICFIDNHPLLFIDIRSIFMFIIPLIGFTFFAFDMKDVINSFKIVFSTEANKKKLLIGYDIFSFMKNLSIGIGLLGFVIGITLIGFGSFGEDIPEVYDVAALLVNLGLAFRILIYGLSFSFLMFEPMKMSIKGKLNKLD